MSANRMGLQAMLKECELFGRKHNLKFSTNEDEKKSKTKCILFTILPKPTKIILDGKPLPWVNELNNLENMLENNNSMNIDCHNKKCKLIGKTHSLLQEFYFSDPDIKMHMINVCASSF